MQGHYVIDIISMITLCKRLQSTPNRAIIPMSCMASWAQLGLHHAALMINHATDQLRYNLGSEPLPSMWGGLHFPFAPL